MQCGSGARSDYANKRLVAVKRMKRRWEGGWDECKKSKELEVYPFHRLIHPPAHFLSWILVITKHPTPPQYSTPLRFLSPPAQQRVLSRVRGYGG